MTSEEILEQQAAWHAKAMQGCLYAAFIYKNTPSETDMERIVLFEKDKGLISSITELINIRIIDPDNSIISLIIPGIQTPNDLLAFIEDIRTLTNWEVNDDENHDNIRLVKMRVPLTCPNAKEETVYAWVLGFGPFDFFPPTRQSPFFEILIPTKSKNFLKNKFGRLSPTKQQNDTVERGGSTDESHIADAFIKDITDNAKMDRFFWASSINRKNQLLADSGQHNDVNAKARVTFSYPINSVTK